MLYLVTDDSKRLQTIVRIKNGLIADHKHARRIAVELLKCAVGIYVHQYPTQQKYEDDIEEHYSNWTVEEIDKSTASLLIAAELTTESGYLKISLD